VCGKYLFSKVTFSCLDIENNIAKKQIAMNVSCAKGSKFPELFPTYLFLALFSETSNYFIAVY
jgi:hypothetical protein